MKTDILSFVRLFIYGSIILISGVTAGYLIGYTLPGQYMPRICAVGTGLSFLMAVFQSIKCDKQITVENDNLSYIPFFMFCLGLSALLYGSSVSAILAWQMFPEDRIAGILPHSDARLYYEQLLNWPDKYFSTFNSRRPLNAVLNLTEFSLGGETLLGMIVVRIVLLCIALTTYITALSFIVGRSAAMTVFFGLVIWSWKYSTSLLSEVNGITISLIGFSLLFLSFVQKKKILVLSGIAALAISNLFRPYNPLMPLLFAFVIPYVVFIESVRKKIWIISTAIFVAVIITISIPTILHNEYCSPKTSLNSNTGSCVLGVARGTGWREASSYIISKYPNLSERESNSLMYDMAIKTVMRDYRPMSKVVIDNTKYSILHYIDSISDAFSLFDDKSINIWLIRIYFLCSIVMIIMNIKKMHPVNVVVAVSIITLLSIAPIIYQKDIGWRIIVTLYPGLILLLIAIPVNIRYYRDKTYRDKAFRTESIVSVGYQSKIQNLNFAILLFIMFSLIYPKLSQYLEDKNRSESKIVILDVIEGEKAHWTDLNRAIVSPEHITQWINIMGNKKWQDDLKTYSNSIEY